MTTSLHDIPGEHVVCIPFREHAAATASESMYAWVSPFKCKITGMSAIFDANITGAATNYTEFAVDADGTTMIDIVFESGTNATEAEAIAYAGDPVPMDAGKLVGIAWDKYASGLKIPTGLLVIKYQGA